MKPISNLTFFLGQVYNRALYYKIMRHTDQIIFYSNDLNIWYLNFLLWHKKGFFFSKIIYVFFRYFDDCNELEVLTVSEASSSNSSPKGLSMFLPNNFNHRLWTPGEEMDFTAQPKIHSRSQIFRHGWKHISSATSAPIFQISWFY